MELAKLVSDHITYSYQHLITGSKKPIIPDGPFGGIIADEMGLGKSLTMLSAIICSLKSAYSFAHCESSDGTIRQHQRVASKATLVLVPSVCK